MSEVTCIIHGKPGTAGSKRAFAYVGKDGKPHARVAPDNPLQKPFMQTVAAEMAKAANGVFWHSEALFLSVLICRVRPKNHYRSGKNHELLKADAPDWPTTRPDSLKIVRAVEDAMKGIVFRDDSQIVMHQITKAWSETECVEIRIYEA